MIGSVFFGTLDFSTRGPDVAASAFSHSAQIAIAISACFSLVAFALVFTLPQHVADEPNA